MSDMPRLARVVRGAAGLASHATVLFLLAGVVPARPAAQQPATAAASLVFDGVTVVDVEHGKLVPAQRVVITGTRIRAVGAARTVPVPKGARVVEARGKYLIPGLWDVHFHGSLSGFVTEYTYPVTLALGVTGIRDPSSAVPLDTLRRWRREILAGTRVGPPRQIYTGPGIVDSGLRGDGDSANCHRKRFGQLLICVAGLADARHVVDSLQAAGADEIKLKSVHAATYFAIAAEARRIGIPFGGHAENVAAIPASDSGARIIDHFQDVPPLPDGLRMLCMDPESASVERCRAVAERFRRNGTWWVAGPYLPHLASQIISVEEKFWAADSVHERNWLHDVAPPVDSLGELHIAQLVGMPILPGTDPGWGFPLHAALAEFVAEGLTPLAALQSATLSPAKAFHLTDSLGTVAAGKLADLVLLDANPLEDITNTTTIHAVVANGRYLDRAALDNVLAQARAIKDLPWSQGNTKIVEFPKGP